MMGDRVRVASLLCDDQTSESATVSTDAGTQKLREPFIALTGRRHDGQALRQSSGQALLSEALAKAAPDTVCSEPPDLLLDAPDLKQVGHPLRATRRWCADSCQ